MARPRDSSSTHPQPAGRACGSRKRKEHPSSTATDVSKRAKVDHRAKSRDARILPAQTSFQAFTNGEINVEKFVKAREFEIKALEEGMARSKKALNKRAFQQVPKDLRRRTASHNVKRVPKRLRTQAKREMVEDKTPTVTVKKRQPTRHMRLRIETAKKLRGLGVKLRGERLDKSDEKIPDKAGNAKSADAAPSSAQIKTRGPRLKTASLSIPQMPRAKFRKRQLNKTWLPTHIFHAKRARMTSPKEPLWRFAVPLTPTAKSYRPTHRAANLRGAIAWDMSYVSTIGLVGQQRSIQFVLEALGVDNFGPSTMGVKWKHGTRVWEGILHQREEPKLPIAPVTVIWSVASSTAGGETDEEVEKRKRSVFLRVHPSAFHQLWKETLRMSKVAKPQVNCEDLRFEIGSIEIVGPGATEALHGALWLSPATEDTLDSDVDVKHTWQALRGLASPGTLPVNVLLGFEIQDPRLHYPPQTIDLPTSASSQNNLLNLLASWPLDAQQVAPSIFDRHARLAGVSAMSSQKAINRRKSLASPGSYPNVSSRDPRIPALLYCSTFPSRRQAGWTVLLPWKCVRPAWYSLMYYPLSTGMQPRFGGLDETRQIAFETGQSWFPGDFPGTAAGWDWEIAERRKRTVEWERRPKSRRINWAAVDLGAGQKGEIGDGWACDWERLIAGPPQGTGVHADETATAAKSDRDHGDEDRLHGTSQSQVIVQMDLVQAQSMLCSVSISDRQPGFERLVSSVCVKLLSRGNVQTCARVYRLPSASTCNELRKQWLDLRPGSQTRGKRNQTYSALPRLPKDTPAHLVRQRLAAYLLDPPRAGDSTYPICPGEADLIGFITAGNYNLAEGCGTGIGNILLSRVIEAMQSEPEIGRLCIVRNAGNGVGRLAMWELT